MMEAFLRWLLLTLEDDIILAMVTISICIIILIGTVIIYGILWAGVKVLEILIKSLFMEV